ncbi:MAG: Multidrug resistance protein MdtG [Candidatus Thorarchaeota archaeon AB_25]|nr:MAG: Multidrug resistance protein MdtG [Candidatus Thorarchaeota archaeon AB_25]
MGLRDRAVTTVYLAYSIQAMAQAIIWQWMTFFVKHDLFVEDFLVLTFAWSAPALVVMIATNVWGSISDRIGRRKPFMIVGFLGYASTFFFYSLVTDVFQFVLVGVVGAVFSSAALPMGQAHLTTGTDKKGERLGFFLAAQSGGWFFGALSSGLLIDIIGMRPLFILGAVLGIGATASCVIFIRDIPFETKRKEDDKGIRELLRIPGMIRLVSAVGLSQIGMNSVSYVMAIIIVDELGGLTAYVGFANSGATIIAVLITGYIGKIIDRKGPVKVLIAAFASYSVFAALFAMVSDPIAASILWAFPIYPLSSTATSALAAYITSEDERGRAMSLVYGAQNAGGFAGPVIGGLFAQFVFGAVQPISWLNMSFNIFALILGISLLRVVGSGRSTDLSSEEKIELTDLDNET